MIASLLYGLDPELHGFKDQILASETLPTAANAYSWLSRSSLGQPSLVSTSPFTGSESSIVVSNSDFRGGGGHGGACGGHGGHGFHGGSRDGGRTCFCGDRKCDHCSGTNHTETYCWQKYGEPNYAHQVTKGTTPSQSQPQFLLNIQTKKMIGLGHEKDGLYFLNTDHTSAATMSSALSAIVSRLQWHFCLGHPSLAKLKLTIPALSPMSSLECEACQLRKQC
ncbi:uncharacterized protein LOC130764266 [Actinidia eriantha]|uniref:uncharacterized protein LOC130764266 n=1 Tax=Actinidia eriantha TaxID=165200 RepID=UPI002585886C|nr:uncharacterized protein LOC130764266 [Actinidia eriantha]